MTNIASLNPISPRKFLDQETQGGYRPPSTIVLFDLAESPHFGRVVSLVVQHLV